MTHNAQCRACGSYDIDTDGTDGQPYWCKDCGSTNIGPAGKPKAEPPKPTRALRRRRQRQQTQHQEAQVKRLRLELEGPDGEQVTGYVWGEEAALQMVLHMAEKIDELQQLIQRSQTKVID